MWSGYVRHMIKRQSYASHAYATLVLGLPLVGSHLAQMALHVTDTVLLGWYGVNELAAVVLAASMFFAVFILGAGFAQAVMPMVASALGRGDEVQVRRDTRMGLWLSIGFGLLTYPLFWWSEALLLGLGQRPEVAALGQDFLRIGGLGMIPALLVMALKSYLAALERTQVVLWTTLAAVGVNLVLAYALIFGHWGAPAMGQVFRLGWPIGITGLAETGMFQASALMMGWIGTEHLAAHGITMEVASLSFMVHLGLSNAATVRAGRAEGAGNAAALRDGAKTAIALAFVVGVVMVTLFLTLPEQIIALFLDATSPDAAQIIRLGAQLLAVAALFQQADAMQVMALGLLRGIRDTRVPMIAAAVSYWLIGIPCSYALAFPLGLGGTGLWLGLVVGLLAAAGSMMWRFWHLAPKA